MSTKEDYINIKLISGEARKENLISSNNSSKKPSTAYAEDEDENV